MSDGDIGELERAARAAPHDLVRGAALARGYERANDRRLAFAEWSRLERAGLREATARILDWVPWPGPSGPGLTGALRGRPVRAGRGVRQKALAGVNRARIFGASASRLFLLAMTHDPETGPSEPLSILALSWPGLEVLWRQQLEIPAEMESFCSLAGDDPFVATGSRLQIFDGEDGSLRGEAWFPRVVWSGLALTDRYQVIGSPKEGDAPEVFVWDLVARPGKRLERYSVPSLAPLPREALGSGFPFHAPFLYRVSCSAARGRSFAWRQNRGLLEPIDPEPRGDAVEGEALACWNERNVLVVTRTPAEDLERVRSAGLDPAEERTMLASLRRPRYELRSEPSGTGHWSLPAGPFFVLLPYQAFAAADEGEIAAFELTHQRGRRSEPRALWRTPLPAHEGEIARRSLGMFGADEGDSRTALLYLLSVGRDETLVVLRNVTSGQDLATHRVEGPTTRGTISMIPLPGALVIGQRVPGGARITVIED